MQQAPIGAWGVGKAVRMQDVGAGTENELATAHHCTASTYCSPVRTADTAVGLDAKAMMSSSTPHANVQHAERAQSVAVPRGAGMPLWMRAAVSILQRWAVLNVLSEGSRHLTKGQRMCVCEQHTQLSE